MNILVAEDNPDDFFLLQAACEKAGVTSQLYLVNDGQEAVSYLTGDGAYRDRNTYPFPDILLLDLNMPRMNGFEVLKWIRQNEQCRCLVVHVLSASPREADVQRAYEFGVNSYVLKPTRLDQLAAFATALHQWHNFTVLPLKPGRMELTQADGHSGN
jgi:CheY-like chemotaxis protein